MQPASVGGTAVVWVVWGATTTSVYRLQITAPDSGQPV